MWVPILDGLCCDACDTNCDGSIDLTDVAPFITALLDPTGYEQQYPNCRLDTADINSDGSVDLTDVEPFIRLLFGGDPCNFCTGDVNDDGSVDLTDVEGFIECLL